MIRRLDSLANRLSGDSGPLSLSDRLSFAVLAAITVAAPFIVLGGCIR